MSGLFDLDKVVIHQVAAGTIDLKLSDRQISALFKYFNERGQVPHVVAKGARFSDAGKWVTSRIAHEHKLGTLPVILSRV